MLCLLCQTQRDLSSIDIESSLYTKGNINIPKIPHTVEQIEKSIEEEKGTHLLRYLKKVVRFSAKKQFGGLIFGKPELIAEFEKSKNIGQDGTFKSCPTPFKQVYITMFKRGRHFFPAFF